MSATDPLAEYGPPLAYACALHGHTWKWMGGCSCSCHPHAACSVPVHVCEACGDCDYGDNDEANAKREDCRVRRDLEG